MVLVWNRTNTTTLAMLLKCSENQRDSQEQAVFSPSQQQATQLKDLSIPSCCLCSLAAESCPLNLCHGPLQATNINNLNDNQQGKIIKFSKMYQLVYLG